MTKRRQMKSLVWEDIGKQIEFTGSRGRHVDGTLRSFTHGVFSHHGRGEYDVPRVLVTVYAGPSHESHWVDPEALVHISDPARPPHHRQEGTPSSVTEKARAEAVRYIPTSRDRPYETERRAFAEGYVACAAEALSDKQVKAIIVHHRVALRTVDGEGVVTVRCACDHEARSAPPGPPVPDSYVAEYDAECAHAAHVVAVLREE